MPRTGMSLLTIILLFSCSPVTVTQQHKSNTEHEKESVPENFYLDNSVHTAVDSIRNYDRLANKALAEGDTIGARITFEKIFALTKSLEDHNGALLIEWADYDSLVSGINERYDKIFSVDSTGHDAEDLRDELTLLEEQAFGDSSGDVSSQITDSVTSSIPLVQNRKVELALKYFQNKGRRIFEIWLKRTGKYKDLLQRILREEGLPEDLFYLAMIESGLNPKAFSYARASGMWQFIYATGRYYGLRADWWFDERKDPLLSSHAAAKHIKDLYERFDDWYLALAGYNCNPRKIERRIRQYKTRDFWKLKRLPRQTRNYVPTFIAATIIAKNPEKYGFDVEYAEPVKFDTVRISESVDLQIVAQCVDTSFTAIKNLNPAVLRWCTPPNVKNFTLNLPAGSKQTFKENYAKIPDKKKRSWVRHKIRSGETLSTIARKYRTTMSVVKQYNKIRGTLIRAGHYLVIPVAQNKNYYKNFAKAPKKRSRRHYKKVESVPGHKKVLYTVKPGDTLTEIAEAQGVRIRDLRKWNALYNNRYIYPRQTLNLFIPENGQSTTKQAIAKNTQEPGTFYVVRRGDTLWDIAKKYDTSISQLKKMNRKRTSHIRPGEKIKVSE